MPRSATSSLSPKNGDPAPGSPALPKPWFGTTIWTFAVGRPPLPSPPTIQSRPPLTAAPALASGDSQRPGAQERGPVRLEGPDRLGRSSRRAAAGDVDRVAEHAGRRAGERDGQTADDARRPRGRIHDLDGAARMPVRPQAAEDVDARAEDRERRVAHRDPERRDRAIAASVGRRDDLGVHCRSVVAADQVCRPADRHGARVGARARERAARDRRAAPLDLDRSCGCRTAAADHEHVAAELRHCRVVRRLQKVPVRREHAVACVEPLDRGGRRVPRGEPAQQDEAARPGLRHHHLAAERRREPPGKQARLDGGRPHLRSRLRVPCGSGGLGFALVSGPESDAHRKRRANQNRRQQEHRPPPSPASRPRAQLAHTCTGILYPKSCPPTRIATKCNRRP